MTDNTPPSKENGGTEPQNDKPCFVVGIGASAGGQGPLEHLFTAIPPDCGISFVVIMHLPPEGPSFLAEMIARYTTMAVVTAEEGMRPAPDTVQVIPAGRDIVLSGGLLHLEDPGSGRGVRHPIDRFFRSLALEQTERAVAVVLSGAGTDGTDGVKAVREAGGIVVVQDPGSAINTGMPGSAIASGAADFILPVEEIPVKITEIAHGTCGLSPRKCRTATLDEELQTIFAIVKTRTGNDFSSYKANTVMRRIERRMAVNDSGGLRKYIALLKENAQEAHALAQDILIGVTSFFRDPEAFEAIQKTIIPRLFAERDADDPVRIWHPCCATGEEAYSMAFLIKEFLNERKLDTKIQIFATDIDEAAIAQARAGIYPGDIAADLGEERLKAFFTRTGNRWQVVKPLREMIVFAHHSLLKNPPFSRLDLLVCRNFLIYLNPDMQKRLIALFHQVLKPGGFLFLGSAESVGRHSELFSTVDKKWKIFQRLENGRRVDTLFPFATPARGFSMTARLPRPAGAFEPSPGALAEKLLLERYSPPCVVVNEKYEVVHVTMRSNRFLEVPAGEPTRDILRMARAELRPPLRAAIYKAFAEEKEVAFRGVTVVIDGKELAVNVLVAPANSSPPAEKLAMVVFEPAPSPPTLPAPTAGDEEPAGDETSRETLIRQLEEQLHITHEQLQAVTEQLETSNAGFLSANEELISMNEEFQSANEELQSTNEELETSKEELQALNEELVTVNAELQGKVEELNLANNDMENLLTSSEIATLFLDRRLNIKRFTPAMAAIFNLIPADIGRPFRHLAGTIDWPGLVRDAEEVLGKLLPIEREVAAVEGGRCFVMRVLPYRTTEGVVEGIVVTLMDITERKKMEARNAHLASFPQLNPNPILELDLTGTIIFANPAAEKVLEGFGMAGGGIGVFLPADLDDIVKGWDRQEDATFHREITIKERSFGESIFLTPQFDVVRIYAFDITERKQAEEANARLAAIVESSEDAIVAKDLNGTILTWNAGAARMFGYQAAEVIGKSITLLIPPEQHEEEARTLQRLLDGERIDHFETVRLARDGRRIDVSVTVSPIRNGEGRIIGASKIVRDISERKRAQMALAESEERVRRKLESIISPVGDISNLDLADIIDAPAIQSLMDDFFELTGMPMGLIDLQGKVLVGVGWQDVCTKFHRVNPETCRNCVESDVQLSAGVPHGEYKIYKCRNNMWDVATPVMVGDRQFGNLFMGQFFFEDEPLDYELFRSQASQYGFAEKEYIAALEAAPRLSRESLDTGMSFFMKLAGILSQLSYSNLKLARSLAEREALMVSLRESEERFRHMFERHNAVMLLIEPESGAIVDANAAATKFYGHSREDLHGLKIQEINQLPPEEVAAERRRAAEEQRNHFVFPHRIATGEMRWVEVYSTPIEARGKSLLFSIIHDITERKRAEDERETTVQFLRIVNDSRGTGDLVRAATTFFQERSGCEAVGIRLREGDDYPYFEAHGFPQEFVVMENSLCSRDCNGEIIRDEAGDPIIDCMCGNVICGRIDPAEPFFTENGSFWTNSTAALLASTTEEDRQSRTRNRCHGEGYESVALIPLCFGEDRLGILQLNDRRAGLFTPEAITQWERLAGHLAVALAKYLTEDSLRQSEKRYHSLFENMMDGLAYCRMLYDDQGAPVDFVYLDVNDAFGRLTGLENVLGKKVTEVIPGIRETSQDLFEIYGRVALTGEPERFEIYFEPLSAWLSISVYSMEREYFVAVFDDITEQKQAEELIQRHVEELRASNEELTRFNSASVGRELRMIELKKEVNALCEKTGIPPRYPLDFAE